MRPTVVLSQTFRTPEIHMPRKKVTRNQTPASQSDVKEPPFRLDKIPADILAMGPPKVKWAPWENLESLLKYSHHIDFVRRTDIKPSDIDYAESIRNSSRPGPSAIRSDNVRSLQVRARAWADPLVLPPLLVWRTPDGRWICYDGIHRFCFLLQAGISYCECYEMINVGPEKARAAGDAANSIVGFGVDPNSGLELAANRWLDMEERHCAPPKYVFAAMQDVNGRALSKRINAIRWRKMSAPGTDLHRPGVHLSNNSAERMWSIGSKPIQMIIMDWLVKLPSIRDQDISTLARQVNQCKTGETAKIAVVHKIMTQLLATAQARRKLSAQTLVLRVLHNAVTTIVENMDNTDSRDFFVNDVQRVAALESIQTLLPALHRIEIELS
jgi:hypothetical protein